MIKSPPAILLTYICVRDNPMLVSHTGHFLNSYRCHPPGFDHHLLIVCNGGHLSAKNKSLFDGVPCEFYPRSNDPGWDVSAYIDVAKRFDSDLQVCLGESVYFHREGWLKRLMECYEILGKGMYGFFSSHLVRPHLNTTAFAASPEYLRDYTIPHSRQERYDFEHGSMALCRRVERYNGVARLVTWDGCWAPADWRKPENILWRGDQSNCLLRCNHTEKFDGATQQVRQRWSRNADTLLR